MDIEQTTHYVLKNRSWFFVVLLCSLSSCLVNKKFALLQKNDVNRHDFTTDSVYRNYTIPLFEYHLQPSDIIYVKWSSQTDKAFDFFSTNTGQLNGAQVQQSALLTGDLIDPDGNVEFPVIGKVKVAGLTIFQCQEKLKGIAAQYLDLPIVSVRLLNLRVTLLGEVSGEKTVVLTNNRVTMLEAIAQGGGFSDVADRENVKLIRQKGDNVEIIYLNFLKEDFINSPYYYVHQNDILVVPPLRQRAIRKYGAGNLNIFLSLISVALVLYTTSKIK